ncbi:MAG: 4'-phosphopantetheinyl transferase superfamily protein [Terracoccus sp.]
MSDSHPPRGALSSPGRAEVWLAAPSQWLGWRRRTNELDAVERRRLAELEAAGPAASRAYAVLHLLARDVVSEQSGTAPASVAFSRSCDRCGAAHGRPRVLGQPAVHLSLSRTPDLVAVALSSDAPVGVDVERVSSVGFEGFDLVAAHPSERLSGRTDTDRAVSWVRKEAALKALGVGLRIDPETVVTPQPGRPLTLVGTDSPVSVLDLDPASVRELARGMVAAVALAAAHENLVVTLHHR